MFKTVLVDDVATVEFGRKLSQCCDQASCFFLYGDLGAGKTTLTRGFVQGLGHSGNVKSPTYTLVEPYELVKWQVYHFDLYRLADPEELEFMGIRDYFSDNSHCLIEWPDKGLGVLPEPDIIINLTYLGQQRQIEISSRSAVGQKIIEKLESLHE
ncbi:tRNA (adenosine(37)-N6)-threonylcarbamoyltransferase complex ATPase subunit type 1 TsaE [Motilimonas sp. 1_MG-2023]|uniref:tRNA (adenosine(37)-N6)-threonylcarbamoyltransferase complex ATPase subunit type 1 TsaE n=1 Tax=Motilimonas sp. 1_MG-2023 TaxID=3062672 RepID=UPI0026E1DA39|nr:tRNA (adenosine(37)-N6)-threonylcarbamoyltransferase complex ATPase subunit type 1 TsaE [Motilimonas sp. 1_MG-2023]MDO6527769.1 tRNA (adenosine(37)-N6)-threonylcarbamoyltransferase complex ATPase subunit type 1 TsaE [Motilimonas sp. 1_MG-2023]